MHTLHATIESLEGGYSAYLNEVDGIVATGSSVSEIEINLLGAITDFVETCKRLDCDVPGELLGDYRVDFSMDVTSLLSIYSGIFSKAGLERLTGINQKQLWHYANGCSTPRRAQIQKIENGLHRLGRELLAINL